MACGVVACAQAVVVGADSPAGAIDETSGVCLVTGLSLIGVDEANS